MYMALKHLGGIRHHLLGAGRLAEEPMAIVTNATTASQQVFETTLGACVEAAERHGAAPPAMVVLGEIVRLRRGLDWLGAIAGRKLDPDPLRRDSVRAAG